MKTVKNARRANIVFIVICSAVLLVLFRAPRETTPKLPNDPSHRSLLTLNDKKEAEGSCGDCHGPDGQAPLRSDHPPKFRCLLCHKAQ